MIISALHLNSIEWLETDVAVDWPGDFHLRQLICFLLDLLAVTAPPSAQKSLIRGTFLAAIGFEVIKIVMTYTLPSLMKSPLAQHLVPCWG